MRILLTSLFFGKILTTSAMAEVILKTEYITEEVCNSISGCWVDTKTGECPDCVIVTRKIVTEIKEEKKEKVVKSKRSFHNKKSNKKWTCVIGPCDWIDENGNLKS